MFDVDEQSTPGGFSELKIQTLPSWCSDALPHQASDASLSVSSLDG
jgi:hypothetical protein